MECGAAGSWDGGAAGCGCGAAGRGCGNTATSTVAKEYSNQHPNASDERRKQTIDETTRAATDNARTTTNAHTHTRTRIRFVRVLVVGVEVESKSRGIVGNQTNNGRGGGSGTTGSERKRQSASNQQGSGNQPPINKPTQSYSMRLDVPSNKPTLRQDPSEHANHQLKAWAT